ncbi:VOC family protein [Sphingomonas sp. BIUV-7]|uniref:VOC family protein n=1 Tax=Sphingomonas natans TaxID=3063330 RepID=A0ABT8Y6I8_9SPHN|nr:VOC family protein [Sphingomonas sp. BIUV-7]MDO6413936.1 VOC family protein [Sphingomonas sp. BIUV-7]
MSRNRQGEWVWYELLTSDADAAQAFYEKVAGWTIARAELNGEPSPMDYRILTAPDGRPAGGLMKIPEGAPMPPAWLGYLGVDDVDSTAAAVEQAGGAIYMPPHDLPGVGRFALLADPQGVSFYVMRGEPDERSTAYGRYELGHCSWNELITPDDAAALAFYGRLFGFVEEGAMPMGAMGEYSFLRHTSQSEPFGAMMPQQPSQPVPAWLFYFRVPDIDVCVAAVKAEGGRIVTGPMEVPGGERVIMAIDPQGAVVGFVAPKP